MVYRNNIPQATDFLDQSQVDLLNNFAQLDTSFGIDHYEFSDVSGDTGKHKSVTMPENTVPTIGADEGGLYTKVGVAPNPTETNMFFVAEGGTDEYQMTYSDSTNFATFSTNTTYVANHSGGWSFLPGGLIMFYGVRSTPGSSGTITFPFEYPNNVFTVVTTSNGAGSKSNNVTSQTTTGFNYSTSNSSQTINWMAIGN